MKTKVRQLTLTPDQYKCAVIKIIDVSLAGWGINLTKTYYTNGEVQMINM